MGWLGLLSNIPIYTAKPSIILYSLYTTDLANNYSQLKSFTTAKPHTTFQRQLKCTMIRMGKRRTIF